MHLYRRSETTLYICNDIWHCKISPYRQKEVLKWAKIAERYMGKSNAEAFAQAQNQLSGIYKKHGILRSEFFQLETT